MFSIKRFDLLGLLWQIFVWYVYLLTKTFKLRVAILHQICNSALLAVEWLGCFSRPVPKDFFFLFFFCDSSERSEGSPSCALIRPQGLFAHNRRNLTFVTSYLFTRSCSFLGKVFFLFSSRVFVLTCNPYKILQLFGRGFLSIFILRFLSAVQSLECFWGGHHVKPVLVTRLFSVRGWTDRKNF